MPSFLNHHAVHVSNIVVNMPANLVRGMDQIARRVFILFRMMIAVMFVIGRNAPRNNDLNGILINKKNNKGAVRYDAAASVHSRYISLFDFFNAFCSRRILP